MGLLMTMQKIRMRLFLAGVVQEMQDFKAAL